MTIQNEKITGNQTAATTKRIAAELDSAFSTIGFVYLKNHGIDQQTVRKNFQNRNILATYFFHQLLSVNSKINLFNIYHFRWTTF